MLGMRGNVELRNLAWERLWAGKWFGRLFGGGLLLNLCGYAVNIVIAGMIGGLGVDDWQDYWIAARLNSIDHTTPIPNLTDTYIVQATAATVFEMFIGYVVAGIVAYGAAVILLRCLRNDENGWLGAAFGGFKDPFGLLWLFVRFVWIFLWRGLLLILLPPVGIWLLLVAFYRYRFLFLVKAEHPDWSAGECFRSCQALMKGRKWASFKLDCSYWKPITLMLVLLLGATAAIFAVPFLEGNTPLVVLCSSVVFVASLASFFLAIVLGQYISVGQGLFYQDLKDGRQTNPSERDDD